MAAVEEATCEEAIAARDDPTRGTCAVVARECESVTSTGSETNANGKTEFSAATVTTSRTAHVPYRYLIVIESIVSRTFWRSVRW